MCADLAVVIYLTECNSLRASALGLNTHTKKRERKTIPIMTGLYIIPTKAMLLIYFADDAIKFHIVVHFETLFLGMPSRRLF